ncbi:MAG: hypothetical protein WKF84_09965 [Pyrinomonadaceae bacterium]
MRDLLMYVPVVALLFWLSRSMRFTGDWTIYTAAIVLFSVGMLVQYRLYSDPEYNARNKSAARAEKTQTLRLRYINKYYDAEKKRMLGLPANTSADELTDGTEVRRTPYSILGVLTSTYTWRRFLPLRRSPSLTAFVSTMGFYCGCSATASSSCWRRLCR